MRVVGFVYSWGSCYISGYGWGFLEMVWMFDLSFYSIVEFRW